MKTSESDAPKGTVPTGFSLYPRSQRRTDAKRWKSAKTADRSVVAGSERYGDGSGGPKEAVGGFQTPEHKQKVKNRRNAKLKKAQAKKMRRNHG